MGCATRPQRTIAAPAVRAWRTQRHWTLQGHAHAPLGQLQSPRARPAANLLPGRLHIACQAFAHAAPQQTPRCTRINPPCAPAEHHESLGGGVARAAPATKKTLKRPSFLQYASAFSCKVCADSAAESEIERPFQLQTILSANRASRMEWARR